MDFFRHGAGWLKVDFHLHTKADREFKYDGDENSYISNYVNALKRAGISVGIIANHNKFDFDEFKALEKKAKNEGIFLLPGVELSVNDGSNGVHTLIIFSDEWLEGGNYIKQFLDVAFSGKLPEKYENENGRSSKNLIDTIKTLEEYQKDFFIVPAHVEQNCGLWTELKGGRLQEIGKNELFTRRTLGFQKVRTRDNRDNVKQWFGGWYPAEVEGSDPKSIEEIGTGKSCFIKLGAFSFEAVKFALHAHTERLRTDEAPKHSHSHIRQIRFEGGTLDNQSICFSPELNTLIGIRGSGKSSVLEAIRYTLGIPIEEDSSDHNYKQKLIEKTFGSGGKVVIDATDRHGQSYQIERILYDSPNVYSNGKLQPGVTIRETILHKPLFFGQRELAANSEGAEKDLIEKLLGTKCSEVRQQIHEQKVKVEAAIERLARMQDVDEQIEEQENAKCDAEHRLNFYKKHNLEEKLQKQLGFNKDISKAEKGIELIETFLTGLKDVLANYEDDLRNFLGYSSTDNVDFFENFECVFSQSIKSVDTIKEEIQKTQTALETLRKEHEKLIESKKSLADDFASIERMLTEELKSVDGKSISTDDFLKAKKDFDSAEAKLVELKKRSAQNTTLETELSNELQKLQELWHTEFKIIQNELFEISNKNTALKFSVIYRGDKVAFLDYFQSVFGGSNMRKATLKKIVDEYPDCIAIHTDLKNAKQIAGSNPEKFEEIFKEKLRDLLTYQTPNKYTICYHGMELEHHSLGQRASALILFVLGQRENDVIIIDQPEDDLDSKTIYDDVITLIKELKPSVQFIFATHNPNITVLGDAEQIHGCSFVNDKINVQSGALDAPEQQELIVTIMEGGKEAFDRRKEIYKEWKS